MQPLTGYRHPADGRRPRMWFWGLQVFRHQDFPSFYPDRYMDGKSSLDRSQLS